MGLYRVKHHFSVVVEAENMFEAIGKAHDAYRIDRTIPAIGEATLIQRPGEVPKEWKKRRPAGVKSGPSCEALAKQKKEKRV